MHLHGTVWPAADADGDERQEAARVAVDGKDVNDGARVEVIAVRYSTNLVDLYVPARSHTVRFDAHAVATLAAMLAPDGPASVTVMIESHTGEFTIIPARTEHGREMSEKSITGLMAALLAAKSRVRRFGWSPPARRAKKTA